MDIRTICSPFNHVSISYVLKVQSQNNIIRGQSLFGEALVTSSVSLNIDQYYTKWTLALVEYYYLLLK